MTAHSAVGAELTTGRLSLRLYIMLTLLALAVLSPGLATLPVTDRDEARFAQASRQMSVSGDWVDIRFPDETRYKKPAGIYWLQATAVNLSGQAGASEIWVHRLPSLFAAALACATLAWAGAPLVGRRAAAISGAMMAALLIVQVEARLAKTDAALLLATILAMGALFRARLGQNAAWIAFLFWTALAAGVLLKGPVIMLPVSGLIFWLWVREGHPRWLIRLHPLPGALWAASLTLPWYLAIIWTSDGTFLSASLGQDFGAKLMSGQESHGAPPGSYLMAFWLTFWPWTALVPTAAFWAWHNRDEVAFSLLAGWCIPAWIVLEIVPTKLLHYPLSLYPALLLVVGAAAIGLLDGRLRFKGRSSILGALFFAGTTLALAALMILGPARLGEGIAVPATLGALLSTAFGALALFWLWREAPERGLIALGASGAAMLATAAGFGLPSMDRLWIAEKMVGETRLETCIEGPVAIAGHGEPSTVFRLGGDTLLTDVEGAKEALAAGRAAAAWIAADAAGEAGGDHIAEIEGFNYSNGQDVRLRLHLPPGAAAKPCAEVPS
ncbi:MAG: glycosyltransferase family 39 protein [Pseudomonadota bacterium]